MTRDASGLFRPGKNIAIKVPLHQFDALVAFYRDVVRLTHLGRGGRSEKFAFGELCLWLDPVPQMSQAEVCHGAMRSNPCLKGLRVVGLPTQPASFT